MYENLQKVNVLKILSFYRTRDWLNRPVYASLDLQPPNSVFKFIDFFYVGKQFFFHHEVRLWTNYGQGKGAPPSSERNFGMF